MVDTFVMGQDMELLELNLLLRINMGYFVHSAITENIRNLASGKTALDIGCGAGAGN